MVGRGVNDTVARKEKTNHQLEGENERKVAKDEPSVKTNEQE